MYKATIIGTGSVGATIAYTLAVTSLVSDLVLIDINNNKAVGEALDIRQGMPYCGPTLVHAGDYSDAKDSDIVIITSGMARKPGQSRLDLTQVNVNIIKSIIPEITKYAPDATYIIVSNPVDIITYVFNKHSGIPENRIIGTGTILDTARLRSRISECYSVDQQDVHAFVFGEHGDSSLFPWSIGSISNVPIDEYHKSFSGGGKLPGLDHAELETYVRKSGAEIIERKGATFYAVSLGVMHICRAVLGGGNTAMTVSSMLHGEYGIDDICLSLLSVVGEKGIEGKILAPLTDAELAQFRKNAATLKTFMNGVDL